MKALCACLLLLLLGSCGADSETLDLPKKLELADVEPRVRSGIHAAYDELVADPSVENYENYAELLQAHAFEDDAFKIWEDLIEKHGSTFRREYLAGRTHFKTDPERARSHFEAARKFDPNYSANNICLAEIYESAGELDKAEKLLLDVGGKDRSGTVPFALGRIFFQRSQFQRALRKLDEARLAAPDHRPLLNLYIQTLSRLDRGDEADALAKKLQNTPEEGATPTLKIEDPVMRGLYLKRLSFVGLVQRAQAEMAMGRHAQAAELFALVSADKPDDLALRNGFAESLQKAGRLEESREQFAKSLEIKPDQPQVVYMLGLAEFQLENIDAGIRLMRQMKTLDPSHIEARQMLATALWKTDPKAAALELRYVLAKEPNNLNGRLLLARIHFETGRLLEGEEELKRIYQIRPGFEPARDLERQFLGR